MSLPDEVHGAWTRQSIAIDGWPRFETQHVVWLQAGPCYADLRVPFHPDADVRCFAGRSGWIGDRFQWVHTLDLEGTDAPAAEDIGDLTWRDGALIETGMFPTAGGPVRYEEVWTRLPLGDGPWVVRETAGCCMVRVGIHAIGAHAGADFAACYWTRGDRSWRLVHAIGPSSALPPPNQVDWPVVARGHATAVSA